LLRFLATVGERERERESDQKKAPCDLLASFMNVSGLKSGIHMHQDRCSTFAIVEKRKKIQDPHNPKAIFSRF
jgi:hypothetical protein